MRPRPQQLHIITGVRSCYDEGKRVAETLMFDYHRQHGIGMVFFLFFLFRLNRVFFFFHVLKWLNFCSSVVWCIQFPLFPLTEIRIARIFNTYGPRMNIDDGRVVSNFIAQALRWVLRMPHGFTNICLVVSLYLEIGFRSCIYWISLGLFLFPQTLIPLHRFLHCVFYIVVMNLWQFKILGLKLAVSVTSLTWYVKHLPFSFCWCVLQWVGWYIVTCLKCFRLMALFVSWKESTLGP